MEASEILEQAKLNAEEPPRGWIVLPLVRRKVITGIVGWIFGVIVGFGLLALIGPLMIPHNYQIGTAAAVVSSIFLGILLFVGLGSVWSMMVDVRRLNQADRYLIVITPEDFVKQEGTKIIHVPLMYVRHVTARGGRPPERSVPGNTMSQLPRSGENISSLFFGRRPGVAGYRKRMRTPTTLAFIDTRDDSEVVVATDTAHGDLFMIAGLLKEYAAKVQQIA